MHPLLGGPTRLTVTADLTPLGRGRDKIENSVPPDVYRLFSDWKAASPREVYTENDFSVFMPVACESAGQLWQFDPERAARFLRQFHPRPSLHLMAGGRRAGPDGAFGTLRAISPTHFEIVFRIHAEFELAPSVWLTPACFWGRMIVNRQAGAIEYFRMWVPTDNPLNIHLTALSSKPPGAKEHQFFRDVRIGDHVNSWRDIVRIEQMELVGGSSESAEPGDWSESIDLSVAKDKLTKAFYRFADIDWVPWKEVTALAVETRKPILAVVLWGALDDQSC